MLAAGKLKDKIAVYSTIESKTASGAPVKTLQFAHNLWAEVTKTGNSATQQNDQPLTIGSYQIRIRYSTKYNIAEGSWLLYRDKWLEITGLDDTDPKRRQIVIMAEHDNKAPPSIAV